MSRPIAPTELLRPGVLEGLRVAVFGGEGVAGLDALGASVSRFAIGDPMDDEAAAAAAAGLGEVDVLLCDLRGAGEFHDALEPTWAAVRAVANAAMIPEERGGKVVLLAPAMPALRAALENMARTLSIEWARFGIRAVAVLPGDDTAPEEVASLVAYLCSPAGDYFSGCALALDGPAPRG